METSPSLCILTSRSGGRAALRRLNLRVVVAVLSGWVLCTGLCQRQFGSVGEAEREGWLSLGSGLGVRSL